MAADKKDVDHLAFGTHLGLAGPVVKGTYGVGWVVVRKPGGIACVCSCCNLLVILIAVDFLVKVEVGLAQERSASGFELGGRGRDAP
jgi:hypothetical protein